jgi:predicted glycogen debranching enzyme
MIRIDHVGRDLEANLRREWLMTNGLGGYASGTLVGINTRRYHGLLVAALEPPVQRTALLVRLDERIVVGDTDIELSAAEFRDGTMFPEGFHYLDAFALEDGIPTWTFVAEGALLRRSIWMIPGRNATVIRYRLLVGNAPIDLKLRPLCAARQHHALQRGDAAWHYQIEEIAGAVKVQATPESPALWLRASSAHFHPAGDWYWGYLLRVERERGYDHLEDLYQPGTFHATLRPGDTLTFIASTEDLDLAVASPDVVLHGLRNASARAQAQAQTLATTVPAAGTPVPRDLTAALIEAADDFIVRRQAPGAQFTPDNVSMIAGYPWFTDYGRDAMFALPGLLLGTGRLQEAGGLLRTFAGYLDQGMIPSRFPDTGESPEYASVDASLLFIQSLQATLRAGAGPDLLRDLYPCLREIIGWYQRGTRHGIKMDERDGLLYAGEPATADHPATSLTWMDARFNGTAFTPRVGKPVEVNALWIEALYLMAEWAPLCEDDPAPYQAAAARAQTAFGRRFWYPDGGYLYDVIDGPDGDDGSLRPSQLLALRSARDLIPAARAKRALGVIKAALLTPYGLRSLAPADPRYVGRCEGDQGQRDSAYHQGSVWVWLLGPYVDACRRVKQSTDTITALLDPFVAHLTEAGVGSVSEIFDGDAPHTARGCIAQAWSVAELLRIALSLQIQD